MTPTGSLRREVFVGALLWTAGLFVASGVVLTQVMLRVPDSPRLVHAPFLHWPAVTALAALCLALGLRRVRRGLYTVEQLRARLAAVHGGTESRVTGAYPAEVQPLVEDLNALLAGREDAVARAVARAGDLAHGLKTPLAVLSHEADRLAAAGQPALAATLREQVDRMRRQVDYHLAHARAAASGGAHASRSPVAEAIEGLARALRRLHAERGVEIAVEAPPTLMARVQREDLDELCGNVLDNACRFARRRVAVTGRVDGSHVVITVDDDGPGLAPALRDAVLRRGVRADETGPGSGLGLAIARDLCELYGGSIALGEAPAGGLRVTLRLPVA
jgi:signal transduction histidine kinase